MPTAAPTAPRPLLPHQEAVHAWAMPREHAGLFLDKRLGKCTLAARWAAAKGKEAILVVAPISAIPDWLRELEADGFRGVYLSGDRNQRLEKLAGSEEGQTFYVTNPGSLFLPSGGSIKCPICDGTGRYDMSNQKCGPCAGKGRVPRGKTEPTEISTMPWHVVIIDESPLIKSPQSQINQICHQYLRNADHRMILSGEYAEEGPLDIFEQLRWLNGGIWMSKAKFWPWKDEHFKELGWDAVPLPGHMALIRDAVRASCYVLSRKDAGIGEIKTFERRFCELPPKIRKSYVKAEREFILTDEKEILAETKYATGVWNWCCDLAGGYPKDHPTLHSDHKMKLLAELLLGPFGKEPVVVTFNRNSELAAAYSFLKKRKLKCEWITGAKNVPQRTEAVARFRNGKARVLLGQVRVMKFGMDLSVSDTMFRYSRSSRWADNSQSLDRIVHPTKTWPLAYVDLAALDTVDVEQIEVLAEKKMISRYYMAKVQKLTKARIATVMEAANA